MEASSDLIDSVKKSKGTSSRFGAVATGIGAVILLFMIVVIIWIVFFPKKSYTYDLEDIEFDEFKHADRADRAKHILAEEIKQKSIELDNVENAEERILLESGIAALHHQLFVIEHSEPVSEDGDGELLDGEIGYDGFEEEPLDAELPVGIQPGTREELDYAMEQVKTRFINETVGGLQCKSGYVPHGDDCRLPCTSGFVYDSGKEKCMKKVPAGWALNKQKNRIVRPHKKNPGTALKSMCPRGYPTKFHSLCYKVPSGYKMKSAGWAKQPNCPKGYNKNSIGRCVKKITVYKDKKRHASCWNPWKKVNNFKCKREKTETYKRKNISLKGRPLTLGCPAGKVKKWGSCYNKCPSGWERKFSTKRKCTKICPPGWKPGSLGTHCIRDSKKLVIKQINDVGICNADLPIRIGDECYAK